MTRLGDRLGRILSITDSTLIHLDVEEMLTELLDRARSILEADTAVVLLRDEDSDHLIARAARGLEEEVWQGVRLPVGAGFAGTVAAQQRPIFLDRVDRTTVRNPLLWQKGVQSMLGVPLIADDAVLGVLHVGRLDRRPFDHEDAELLQIAAERIAGAIQTRRLAVESSAARVLERGLLPTHLPVLPELGLAARYISAGDRTVGGDWYDAFTLPDGALWLVIGDVAGHGLRAAVIMGRIKSALRAYALLGEPPDRVLEMTDRKLRHFEIGTIATAACVTSRAPYAELSICSAGHLPPVLAAPGQSAQLLELPVGPPLGVIDATRRSRTVGLPSGGTLLLYTDGLIERRTESIQVGLERLTAAVTPAAPDDLCAAVLRRLVGSQPPIDDIAMLAIHRHGDSDRAG